MGRSHVKEPGVVWTDVHKGNDEGHVLVQLLETGQTRLIVEYGEDDDQWQSIDLPQGISGAIIISLVAALSNNRA